MSQIRHFKVWEVYVQGVCVLGGICPGVKVTQQAALLSNESKYSKLKKLIEIQLVRLTEVCGKVLSERNG